MKNFKKYIKAALLVLIISGVTISDAFSRQSDDKSPILPEKGDWALGFNAVPLLDFALNAVNIMNNTGGNARHPGFAEGYNQVLTGKYFLDDVSAVRLRFGFNTTRETETQFNSLINSFDEVVNYEDKIVNASSLIAVGLGYEKRRGNNRLQGFFGGEGLAGFQRSKDTYEYGAAFSQANNTAAGSQRILESNGGNTTIFGARGFIGVEFFFARKMSIGAEFGLGLNFINNGRSTATLERFEENQNGNLTSVTNEVKGDSQDYFISTQIDDGSGLNMGPGSAALNLNFHF